MQTFIDDIIYYVLSYTNISTGYNFSLCCKRLNILFNNYDFIWKHYLLQECGTSDNMQTLWKDNFKNACKRYMYLKHLRNKILLTFPN